VFSLALGLSLAKRFGHEGFAVVFISRRPEARKAYPKPLRGEGITAYSLCADPANSTALQQAFAEIRKKLGAADVLIYNAIVQGARPSPSKYPVNTLIDDLRIDIVSPLLCAQQVIPDMPACKRGTIVFTAGDHGARTELPFAGMGIGRSGLRSLCLSLATGLKPYGIHIATVTIRANIVDPEFVADTHWDLYRQEPDQRKAEVVVGGSARDSRFMLQGMLPKTACARMC
jgi:NAD(P)-dependent dehydrogenase (short-subunit alcohol dehydrogenase family)